MSDFNGILKSEMSLKEKVNYMPKVLVVDDEPNIRTLVEAVLMQEKYVVITADNGKDCLILAEKEKPDLILLDVMMAKMDGWEVCERLKKNSKTKKIPVVMLTAKEKVLFYSVAAKVGADDYISKPFSNRDLVIAVKKYALASA